MESEILRNKNKTKNKTKEWASRLWKQDQDVSLKIVCNYTSRELLQKVLSTFHNIWGNLLAKNAAKSEYPNYV